MGRKAKPRCASCQRLQAQLDVLRAEVAHLREQLAAAQKNSTTSSKPPSSDLVKPQPAPRTADTAARSPGGQPGHGKHEREPFPPEQVTLFAEHTLQDCPCCGGELRRNAILPRVVQQVDVEKPPLRVEQHTCYEYWCVRCQRAFDAPLPLPVVKGGLVGPRLMALIAYLKGACHASFSTVRTFLRDVVGLTLSRGALSKVLGKVRAALDRPYEELLQALPHEPFVNADETGHPCNGERWWTWCFRAALYALYRIDAHRNAEVLMATLGEDFRGVVGCDYFSAYRRYMKECGICLQFCLAHLIRDVKFLTTLPDAADRQYGESLRAALKELFAVIHQREHLAEPVFQARLRAARDRVLRVGLEAAPPTRHGQNLAKRFREHGAAYFTFLTTPGVEPTNNLAEQAIRFVVIDRRITQGTRSAGGQRWSERMWTVIATCALQGRSVYDFLAGAIGSWFRDEAAPSLLPQGG
jgi:transposase